MERVSSFDVCPKKTWVKILNELKGTVFLGDIKPCQVMGSRIIKMEKFNGCNFELIMLVCS